MLLWFSWSMLVNLPTIRFMNNSWYSPKWQGLVLQNMEKRCTELSSPRKIRVLSSWNSSIAVKSNTFPWSSISSSGFMSNRTRSKILKKLTYQWWRSLLSIFAGGSLTTSWPIFVPKWTNKSKSTSSLLSLPKSSQLPERSSLKKKSNIFIYLVKTKTTRKGNLTKSVKKLKISKKTLKLKTNLKQAKKTTNCDPISFILPYQIIIQAFV